MAGRGTVYCVVPRDLGPELHEVLRDHWRDDPAMIVMLDRREADRRRGPEAGGRRVADRRGTAAPGPRRRVPRRLRDHAARLVFAQRRRHGGRDPEDIEADRLVVHVQRGDVNAFDQLYLRYFDRVYAYARVALRDDHEAEDVAQQVFGNVIQALPRYQVRDDSSFRAWLFRITRNVVLRTLSRNGRLQPQEPAELDRRLESPTPDAPFSLEWLSDKDLAMLVERLPRAQQQVILLRYVFEFKTAEIADVLTRTPVAIRMLEHRAMRALEMRLHAMRGTVRRCDRASMVAHPRPMPVLFRRRLALRAYGGAPL
jgi:RNA polymerase sigma-70 factor, ECF subfamily